MTNQNNYKLILESKEFLVTTNLSRFNNISTEVYLILKAKKEYKIKSNVSEETLIQFINHLINKKIPRFNKDNICEFEQLSNEFNHMEDLIELYHSMINSEENYNLQKQNDELQNKINQYNRIFHHILNNYHFTVISNYLILKSNEIYEIIKTEEGEILDLKTKIIFNHISGFSFILNEEDKTAEIFRVYKEKVSYHFPVSIEYKSHNYTVTKIHGEFMDKFAHFERIKSIKFPENSKIKVIGQRAFEKLKIKKIKIPSSVTQIHSGAFSNCEIKNVEFSINSQLKIFNKYLFYSSGIRTIKIPSSVIRICENALASCHYLKEIIFSADSKIECIDHHALNYSQVERIFLPSKKIELKNGWCSQMSKLNQIVLLNNNNDDEYIKCINNNIFIVKSDIFYDRILISYRNINEIHIPSYIKIICSNAFSNCKFLKKVTFSEDSQLQIISYEAFSGCPIESISIPSSVTHINEYAFYECKNLKSVEFVSDSKLQFIGGYAFSCTSIESVSIPSNVIEIGENAFYHFSSKLIKVQFSNESKLNKIGDGAFKSASIKSISIPSSVTTIGNEAFNECKNLESIEFSNQSNNSLKIGEIAFSGKIENISIPSNIIELNESCFIGMKKLIHISVLHNDFQENIKCIDNKILIGKSDIKSDIFDRLIISCCDVKEIHIPSSIKTICSYAFKNCHSLKKVTFSEDSKLENINSDAFLNCSIKSIRIPKNVSKIGYYSFKDCKNLRCIEFSMNSKLNEIGERCFENAGIEKLLIPSSVEKISCNAFDGCTNLKTVSFDHNSKIKMIDDYVFTNSNVRSISFPSSTLKIGNYCFDNCKKIQIVEINENIDISAFFDKSYRGVYLTVIDYILMIPNQV